MRTACLRKQLFQSGCMHPENLEHCLVRHAASRVIRLSLQGRGALHSVPGIAQHTQHNDYFITHFRTQIVLTPQIATQDPAPLVLTLICIISPSCRRNLHPALTTKFRHTHATAKAIAFFIVNRASRHLEVKHAGKPKRSRENPGLDTQQLILPPPSVTSYLDIHPLFFTSITSIQPYNII